MKKIIYKERIIADYNIGSPYHKTRIRINFVELAKRIVLFALAALILFVIGVEIHTYATAEEVTVKCSANNSLLFYDESGLLIGKVRSASINQFEAIKRIPKIKFHSSIKKFVPSEKDTDFFEIIINGYGTVCFNTEKSDSIPREYNYTLDETESDEMFSLMSDENKFLHDELHLIVIDGIA